MLPVSRFHPVLVTLHWLLAFFVLMSLAMGALVLEQIPNSNPEKIDALRGHMIGGVVILGLMLIRLIVRIRTAHPPQASTGMALADRIAPLTHYAFYGLVILMVASGFTTSLLAGLPAIVFGGSSAPLPPSFDDYPSRVAHGIIASLLMALIVLHISAALYHQFYLKDGLFRRMWFGKRR